MPAPPPFVGGNAGPEHLWWVLEFLMLEFSRLSYKSGETHADRVNHAINMVSRVGRRFFPDITWEWRRVYDGQKANEAYITGSDALDLPVPDGSHRRGPAWAAVRILRSMLQERHAAGWSADHEDDLMRAMLAVSKVARTYDGIKEEPAA
ncbi:MAG: hypothetical protein MPK75_02110 [Alphaproteobacteria bacterium]|nr:hypothetical protein [Alphaproteobacteria bacterium]